MNKAAIGIVEKLNERIVIGYHDDGYAMTGRDKDGNTVSQSRPSTPMTRPANRDGPEAAAIIMEMVEALERVRGTLAGNKLALTHIDAVNLLDTLLTKVRGR